MTHSFFHFVTNFKMPNQIFHSVTNRGLQIDVSKYIFQLPSLTAIVNFRKHYLFIRDYSEYNNFAHLVKFMDREKTKSPSFKELFSFMLPLISTCFSSGFISTAKFVSLLF